MGVISSALNSALENLGRATMDVGNNGLLAGYSVWKKCCKITTDYLKVSPVTGGGNAWSIVTGNLFNISMGIAASLSILFFVIGWLIFTAPSVPGLWDNFKALFGLLGNGFSDPATWYYLTSYLILLILCVLCSTPLVRRLFGMISQAGKRWGQIVASAVYVLLFVTSLAYLVNATYNPFLYFKF